jgi:hypothetical protein
MVRMMPVLGAVLAVGLSMMVLGGLGITDYTGTAGESGLQDEIENEAGENESIQSEESDEGGFISFVIGAVGQMRDLMSLVLFLPDTLMSLGMPNVVARAVGHGTQIVLAVGMVQVALRWEVQ